MPGRDVKHQGASDPSGFRQKFSRRSLSKHAAQPGWVPGHGLEPSLQLLPKPRLLSSPARGPPQVPPAGVAGSQRRPANSLARILFRRKAMLMRMLRVPTLAGHARSGGVDRAPVALAFPAEAIERRGLPARLCLGPLDGSRAVGARVGGETGAGAEPHCCWATTGSRPAPPLVPARPRPHVSQVPSQAPPSRSTAAGEVAELPLHLRVRGIAPGPLRAVRIPAIVVVQTFVQEPGGGSRA